MEHQNHKHHVSRVDHRDNRPGLNLGSLFFGLTLVLGGILYLLSLSGFMPGFVVSLNFPPVRFVWPILLVVVGLSLIEVRTVLGKIAGVVLVLLATIFVVAVLFFGFFYHGERCGYSDAWGYTRFQIPCFFDNRIDGINQNGFYSEWKTKVYPL